MANKIGCSVGKTYLVDPNNFGGQSSTDNMSVPLEDLNISIQLTTFKKGRTVLRANNDLQNGTASSSNNISVTFIEGTTQADGTKSLTTKYTDLTTTFESGLDDSSSETLGITNIDIDFNTSYAPMITISFIDVRGSSIFQNEKKVSNGKNKYSVFFELPYPLFQLTVKGYYGSPVTYCLHMTKFNSKFNSHTGNFEITANFIGYTYAMLSDMLLGYLKAIPNTPIGKEVYKEINDKRKTPILELNQLMLRINSINNSVTKLSATDPDSSAIKTNNDRLDNLINITSQLTYLHQALDLNGSNVISNNYIVVQSTSTPPLNTPVNLITPNVGATLLATTITNGYNPNSPSYTSSSQPTENNDNINTYITNVTSDINEFNAGITTPVLNLNLATFTNLTAIQYKGISINMLDPSNTFSNFYLKSALNNPSNLSELKNTLYTYLKANYTINPDTLLDIYDLTSLNTLITSITPKVQAQIDASTKILANTLKTQIAADLGFDPTVRNIIEVFTTAVEVFMISIYRVSVMAEKDISRAAELSKIFKQRDQSTDIPSDYLGSTNTTATPPTTPTTYFAWPDYYQQDDTKGYMETYLGSVTSIDPSKIQELSFVDSLLQAFLTTQQQTQSNQDILNAPNNNWIPINVFDTNIFTSVSPYARINALKPDDISTLILIRAMTFLGYTNNSVNLAEADIATMASSEANLILTQVKDSSLKQALTNLTTPNILAVTSKINGISTNIVQQEYDAAGKNLFYFYDFIFSNKISNGLKVIPINNFNSTWDLSTLSGSAESSNIFLTNYGSAVNDLNGYPISTYTYDGGQYINIMSLAQYTASIQDLLENVDTNSIIVFDSINGKTDFGLPTPYVTGGSGFKVFGGKYGIQEFVNMDFGSSDLEGLELKYVFYDNSTYNGLGKNRQTSDPNNTTVQTPYDLSKNAPTQYHSISVIENLKNQGKLITDTETSADGSVKTLHGDFGKNREYFQKFTQSGLQTLTYPFINLVVPVAGNRTPISLFGSYFYYAQDTSIYNQYNKAFLFLNTLPFNGLSFEKYEILHLFDTVGGFVHAPRLWAAYIGSLLWRADTTYPTYDSAGINIINGGSGPNDPIVWEINGTIITPAIAIPTRTQYMTLEISILGHTEYTDFHNSLITIPDQAKSQFKQYFFDFVNGTNTQFTSWKSISSGLEIWSGQSATYEGQVNYLYTQINIPNDNVIDEAILLSGLENINNYSIIGLNLDGELNVSSIKTTLFLELKGDYTSNQTIRNIINALVEEVVIANAGYGIWQNGSNGGSLIPISGGSNSISTYTIQNTVNGEGNKYRGINVLGSKLTYYLNALTGKLKGTNFSASNDKKQQEQEIFGSTNENTIKLQIYRTCKDIFDKWLAGVDNEKNIIFQCGGRNDIDTPMAEKYNGTGATPRLIDSFRFVNRSFTDIGDELFINPLPVLSYLTDNPNSSFYDAVTQLLIANNFDFIALPSYINYTDTQQLEKMFEPIQYQQALSDGISGPSFVCVYTGQKSKNLDISGGMYSNDGFDFICNNGGMIPTVPKDYTTPAAPNENNVAVFAVNIGQQNQNIFKDLTLDQSEFTETDESLKIQDDIASKGSNNNVSLAGQNLYNVYSVRSYQTEVEMMGNAMIQPMMYFQLNNIPMFHGAYMIIHVKHNVKPNFMSTHFTGVRIRSVETRLLSAVDVYQELLNTITLAKNSTGTATNVNKNGSNVPIPKVNIIPGTVSVSELMLENGINPNKFSVYKNTSFTDYGTN